MIKPAIKSKGMQGSAVAAAGSIGSIAALFLTPAFHGQAAACLDTFGQAGFAEKLLALSPAIALFGSLLSGYGRYAAGGVSIFGRARPR